MYGMPTVAAYKVYTANGGICSNVIQVGTVCYM